MNKLQLGRLNQRLMGGDELIPTVKFDLSKITFTAAMAKRYGSIFAAAPIVQGARDGAGTPDNLTVAPGTAIKDYFYPNIDLYQGSLVLWVTPEWAGNDGIAHYLFDRSTATIRLYKTTGNYLRLYIGGQYIEVDISAWTAGTTYCVVCRWDVKNKLDGTNYLSISINDTHTFSGTTQPTAAAVSTISIGSEITPTLSASAIIQGLTVYRRPLFDGTYGKNVGNGDEINLIYAAGVGKDPCLVTGSWDVCFCLPTNSTVGALATGTGNAWSHPHSSNLLSDWLMARRLYNNPWSVYTSGSAGQRINCGSDAGLDDLADNAFTFEMWYKPIPNADQTFACKGSSSGWIILTNGTVITARVHCATTAAAATYTFTDDGKWHHIAFTFDDAGDRKVRLFFDGILVNTSSAGVGAIVSDAASELILGANSGYTNVAKTYFGWTRVSNSVRYSADFVPATTPPAADANTLAQWNMEEGTGTTVDNEEGTAGRDGTITAGTWTPEWDVVGTPLFPYSLAFNGTSTLVNCGSDAGLDDLADNEFTAEAWVRIPVGNTSTITIFSKGRYSGEGWVLYWSANRLFAELPCATTMASGSSAASSLIPDGKWHHVALYFNDAGDRKPYISIDGIWNTSIQTAGVGAVITDAAYYTKLGVVGTSLYFVGNMGWTRISNNDRLGVGVNFTPASRAVPPASDANTLAQWNFSEGAGTTLDNIEGTAGRDGTITAGTWVNYNAGSMEDDNGGQRVYNWGLAFEAQADGDGIKQTFTGQTAGADRVLRCVAHSSTADPVNVTVYDETNAAVIKDFDFGASSTVSAPGIALISFELPTNARGAAADCVSYSISITGTAAGQIVYIHQCELLANLLDNPSLDTGAVADPWIPYGATSVDLDAGDTVAETTIIHSTGASLKAESGATAAEGLSIPVTIAANKFVAFGSWAYAQSDASISMLATKYSKQTALSTAFLLSQATGNTWKHSAGIARVITANSLLYTYGDAGLHYLDDLYAIALDDVSLTCTPATQANSLESGGIRVDGLDKCVPNPAISLPVSKGQVKFKWIPRSSAANWYKFKNGVDPRLLYVNDGTANNLIDLHLSAANTMKLIVVYGGVSANTTWDATGAIVAGTTYAVTVRYKGGIVYVDINNVNKIALSAGVFGAALTALLYGSNSTPAGEADSVFLAP